MTTTSGAPSESWTGLRSEAVLLAALPVAGSLIALLFEIGFLSFYDVPLTFTQIDFLRIVIATFLLGIFVAVVFGAFTAVALFTQHSNPIRRALLYPLVVAVFFGPFLYFIPKAAEDWWVFLILVVLIVLSSLLPPLFSRKKDEGYLQRLDKTLEEESSATVDRRVQRPVAHLISQRLLAPLGALMFGAFYVTALGRDHAEGRTVHYVLRDSQDWVLVTAYGDTLIFKSLDPKTGRLGSSIRLQKPADPTTTILVRRNLGRLLPPIKETMK